MYSKNQGGASTVRLSTTTKSAWWRSRGQGSGEADLREIVPTNSYVGTMVFLKTPTPCYFKNTVGRAHQNQELLQIATDV